ncbi:MspA protein [Nocardia amikacinitolerans]|uniref:MspA protein n=1 Tax=Nocardia amikacinitolerans TaxID=756689 RepID=A0A285L249_9NOCA|nr:MspA family porin [Nocardia amikacinitolerans]MCP2296657.1 MspA protein [Nocardia amikacinitolerans]SNY78990.1 MspA protein [Nocardia amikacinitolerans]
MSNRKNLFRLNIAAATTVALGLLATGTADADTFVPLPGGELVKTLSDGTVVTVRLTGESATISPSLGSTPLHRNAWVSGSAQVDVAGAGADGGLILPGYVVGCQVNIAGGGVSGGVDGSVSGEGQGAAGANSGGELSLGPGQATSFYILDREKADDFGAESHKPYNIFGGTSGSVTWADQTIGLSGCGGYAQARAFVSVEIITESVTSWVTLWGQPFSLG